MSRVAMPMVLQSPSTGSAIVGATATITVHAVGAATLGTGAPASIFTQETGGAALASNQIVTDNLGRWTQGESAGYAQYWLPENTYDITISGPGLTAFTVTREFMSAGQSDEVALAGEIKIWAGATAPKGFLLCDGSSYPQASYPLLFAAIGTRYGGVAPNFNVPDLVGMFPAGAGSAANMLGPVGTQGGAMMHEHPVPPLTVPSAGVEVSPHSHMLSSNGGAQIGPTVSSGEVVNGVFTGYTNLNVYFNSGGPSFDALTNTEVHFLESSAGEVLLNTPSGDGVAGASVPLLGNTDMVGADGSTAATETQTGTTDPASSLPPFLAVNFIIRTGVQ